eukprot:6487147-Amphidinium_carterae.1
MNCSDIVIHAIAPRTTPIPLGDLLGGKYSTISGGSLGLPTLGKAGTGGSLPCPGLQLHMLLGAVPEPPRLDFNCSVR